MSSTAGRLDVYNMALGFIGTGTVSSPNEKRPEAIQCELYWDRARRSALRDFPYSFATRRSFLASKELPAEYEDWNFAYGLPDKCLRVLSVHASHNHARGAFLQVYSAFGGIILSDIESAVADYIYDVEDVSVWDELFVMAMARKLACLISTPLLKNNQAKLQELEQLYQMAIPKADAISAAENVKNEHLRVCDWLSVRSGF